MAPSHREKGNPKLTRGEKDRLQRLDLAVQAATAWWYPGLEMRAPILCVRPWRRGRRSCFHRLRLRIESPDAPIVHVCEGCGHVGRIEGWQGSDLDLSGIVVPGDGTWLEVVMTGPQQRELMKICGDDPQVVRVLAAAIALDTYAAVAGPRSVLARIQAPLAAAIRKTRSEKRRAFLTITWKDVEAVLDA